MNEQSLGSMAEDNNNQDNKTPHMKDNVVFFPFHRIKDLNKGIQFTLKLNELKNYIND